MTVMQDGDGRLHASTSEQAETAALRTIYHVLFQHRTRCGNLQICGGPGGGKKARVQDRQERPRKESKTRSFGLYSVFV